MKRTNLNRTDHRERAINYFRDGFSCSQAVFAAFHDDFGLDEKTALKVSGALGGGYGHTNGPCGVVSGALMIIGLKYGKATTEDPDGKERTYTKVREFKEKFEDRFGTIQCTELIGYDLSTPNGLKGAKEANMFRTKCEEIIVVTVKILEEMI
ncbi:MAG: C_GCAxxG_C_C family protein [Methanogenium sp.]|nr:C_GCAxxG_C_C family protein [Methanogenium sp.]